MEAPCDVPSKASRPVLSGRGHPLPASWFRARVYALVLGSLGLVSHSVPGRLNRFDCSLELSQVCRVCVPSVCVSGLRVKCVGNSQA